MTEHEKETREVFFERVYGPVIRQFVHNIKDKQGNVISQEEMQIRRNLMSNSDNKKVYCLSLIDSEGRRVAYNVHKELASEKIIESMNTYTNSENNARIEVAKYNLQLHLTDPYRVVPRSAAAMLANYRHFRKDIIHWYSSDDLTAGGPRTGNYLYKTSLNKHFSHLVTSEWDSNRGRYVVSAK